MDTFFQDVRYALRTLLSNPGFAALTILCLSLGIGVNSAIFSIVDSIAIRPLPYQDPERLVSIYTSVAKDNRNGVSIRDLLDWKSSSHGFATLAVFGSSRFSIADRDDSERVDGAMVSAEMFPMIGIQPVLGRQFRADEDAKGAAPVALISDGLWRRRYSADPNIVGRSVMVNDKPTTIIGVMPPRFAFPESSEIWMPLLASPTVDTEKRTAREFAVWGRLAPSISLEAARADLKAVAARLAATEPDDKDRSVLVMELRDDLMPNDVRVMVYTMMGAVTFVLLIACGNVANLLLARATVRQREIAVRAALGAGRARIVRQLLTESVIIGLASLPAGVVIAYAGLRWLSASVPPGDVPYYINWDMNSRVLVYAAIVAIVTGVVFGLAPALQAARGDLHESLKDGGRGSAGSGQRARLRSVLVVGEIALALIVLVGASLFVRTFRNYETARAGLPTQGLMTLRVWMIGDRYAAPAEVVRRTEDLMRRVEALPGVTSAVASEMAPYSGGSGGGAVVPEGQAFEKGKEPTTMLFGVTPHLLRTLNQPLVAGRDFTEAEGRDKSHVAIVNQAFAKKMWPNLANGVGQRFRFVKDEPPDWLTVIGEVNDFRLFTVRDGKPPPYAFLPYPYDPQRATALTIRVAGMAPAAITSAVRREIRASDPTLTIYAARTADDLRAETYWDSKLFGVMFSIFGLVALFLASVGVYGMLSYSVSQRTQEIGVRMALGASRGNVFGLVVSQGLKLAGAGIGLGMIGAFAVTRVIASQLYNVSPTDPLSFIATASFLAIVALIASYVPARRATAVDPMIALRAE